MNEQYVAGASNPDNDLLVEALQAVKNCAEAGDALVLGAGAVHNLWIAIQALGGAPETGERKLLLSDRADELIRELHGQGMVTMRSVFDGAILTILPDRPAQKADEPLPGCPTPDLCREKGPCVDPAGCEEWRRKNGDAGT